MRYLAGRGARRAFIRNIVVRPAPPSAHGWFVLGACRIAEAPACLGPHLRLVRHEAVALAVYPAALAPPDPLPEGLAPILPVPVMPQFGAVSVRLHRTVPQLLTALEARSRCVQVRIALLGGPVHDATAQGMISRISAWIAQESAACAESLCRTPDAHLPRPDQHAWLALSLLVDPGKLPPLRALLARARALLAGTQLLLVVSGPGEGRGFPLTEWAA